MISHAAVTTARLPGEKSRWQAVSEHQRTPTYPRFSGGLLYVDNTFGSDGQPSTRVSSRRTLYPHTGGTILLGTVRGPCAGASLPSRALSTMVAARREPAMAKWSLKSWAQVSCTTMLITSSPDPPGTYPLV